MSEKVSLHVLFIQRKNLDYAPEAVEVMDDFGMDENPQYLLDKLEAVPETYGGDIVSAKIIQVEIDYAKVREILNSTPKISGEVKP